MSEWNGITDTRDGGLVYKFPCGHTYTMTKAAIRAYLDGAGADAPPQCPTCTKKES